MKAITGATLIDGTGGPAMGNAIVLIDEDRIEAVGPAGSIQVPADAEVVDGSGMTLLPGLIDCHDHLASMSYEIASRWGITEMRSQRHLRIASVLRQTLETGYTTVRDAGGLDAGFRMAVDEGLAPGLSALGGGVALHLACHARAQNIGPKARDMLALIPDADIEVIERC